MSAHHAERRIPPVPAVPQVSASLPGPHSARLIAADEQVTSSSYTRPYPLAVRRGVGCWIEDLDGNLFLDFTAGIAVCTTGHCHPRVVAAIRRQAEALLHMCGADFYYPPFNDLAQKLTAIAPGPGAKRVLFTNSGAESIEAAIKLARYATGRATILAFHGAFHGRTLGALSLTASKVRQRQRFGPLLPGVLHADYGHRYRCPLHDRVEDCGHDCLHFFERHLFRQLVAPEEVAAIVVEPILGEGGYIVPPATFHQQLRRVCDRHGILYVADEIQSGMGRTGRMFALEHWGVAPDILCLAKGLASGLPLGAIVARAEIMSWEPGAHASTFGGNPLACVAALETIALLEEGLMANAAAQGEFLRMGLRRLAQAQTGLGKVRGLGLMLGVEFVDPADGRPDPQRRDAVVQACFRRGLLVLGCGESVLRLCPPLVVSEEECAAALKILAEGVQETALA